MIPVNLHPINSECFAAQIIIIYIYVYKYVSYIHLQSYNQ